MAEPQTTTFNKIGLHIGPYTNPELLQIWLNQVDQANIPMFLTVVGDFHFLFNLVGRLGFPANHTIVFQFHPQQLAEAVGSQFDFTNADFYRKNQSPEQISLLADEYWQQIARLLPSDFPRDKVWLELPSNLSELPRNEQTMQADWLGEFGWALTRRTTVEGYKVALFSWSSGQPDPGAWRTNGMLRLLDYSQKYPDQIAVAVKEFSGRLDSISPDAPESGIGRFRSLVQVCAEEGIMPPPIFITEWGWTRERIPNPRTALNHIVQANEELYAHYPAVRGAALWSLDPDAGPVADQVSDLVERLAELTAARQFEVRETDPYATEENFSSESAAYPTYNEDSDFKKISDPSLPGDDYNNYQTTQQTTAQQAPIIKGASNLDIPDNLEDLLTQTLTPTPEEAAPLRPPHAWLSAVPENGGREALSGADPVTWAIEKQAQVGDLLLLFENGTHNQITHLANVMEPPQQQGQADPGLEPAWTAVLHNITPLAKSGSCRNADQTPAACQLAVPGRAVQRPDRGWPMAGGAGPAAGLEPGAGHAPGRMGKCDRR